MDTSTTNASHDDQEQFVRTIVHDWAKGDRATIDVGVARMLAAALRSSEGTALQHFAETGTLRANDALAELNDVRVPLEREVWIEALGDFILQGDRP